VEQVPPPLEVGKEISAEVLDDTDKTLFVFWGQDYF